MSEFQVLSKDNIINDYCSRWQLSTTPQGVLNTVSIKLLTTVKPRFNEVGGDGPNMFVKWRVSYIENLDITNLRGNDKMFVISRS